MKTVKFVLFIACGIAAHLLDCILQLDVGNVALGPLVIPLIAAGAKIASGVASGIGQNAAVNKANKFQAQLQREQNQWNLEQWNREKAFSEEMWNKENEYNSAVNQRKRLEQAGLNPYLMMNQGNAGIAQSVSIPSGQPAAPAFAPQIADYSYFSNMIDAAGSMFTQLLGTEGIIADNELKKVQAQYAEQETLSRLVNLYSSTDKLRGEIRKNAQETINLSVEEQLKRAAARVENFNADHLDENWNMKLEEFNSNMASARVLRKVQLDQNNRADRQLAADIQHTMALITEAYANADLDAANRAVAYAQEHFLGQQANTEGERTREQKVKADKAADVIESEIGNLNRQNRGKIVTEGKNIGEYVLDKWKNARKQEWKALKGVFNAIKNSRK